MEKVKILFIAILFSLSVLSAISYTEFVDIYYDYSGSNSQIGNFLSITNYKSYGDYETSYSLSLEKIISKKTYNPETFTYDNIKSIIVDYEGSGLIRKTINKKFLYELNLRTSYYENNYYDFSFSTGSMFGIKTKLGDFKFKPVYTNLINMNVTEDVQTENKNDCYQISLNYSFLREKLKTEFEIYQVNRNDDYKKRKNNQLYQTKFSYYLDNFAFSAGYKFGNSFLISTGNNSYLNTTIEDIEYSINSSVSFYIYQKISATIKYTYSEYESYSSRAFLFALTTWF